MILMRGSCHPLTLYSQHAYSPQISPGIRPYPVPGEVAEESTSLGDSLASPREKALTHQIQVLPSPPCSSSLRALFLACHRKPSFCRMWRQFFCPLVELCGSSLGLDLYSEGSQPATAASTTPHPSLLNTTHVLLLGIRQEWDAVLTSDN